MKPKSPASSLGLLAGALTALLAATTAHAADQTWNNGAATGNWNPTDANFGGTWTTGNTAVFGGTAGSTVTINAAGVSAAGVTFNVNNDIIAQSGSNILTLTGTATVSVGGGLAATISAPIAGTAGLTVSGGGTLTESVAGTYTGGTTVSGAGTVLSYTGGLTSSSSAPSLSNGNILIDAGQLKLGTSSNQDWFFGTNAVAHTLTVQNGGSIGSGALTLGTNQTNSFRGWIIGDGTTSNSNAVTIKGANSFIANNGANSSVFELGNRGSSNTMSIENGAVFQFQKGSGTNDFHIGNYAGANGNILTVTGSNSKLYSSSIPVIVGGAGNDNALIIEAGAYFKAQRLQTGDGGFGTGSLTGGTGNYVSIAGTGTARSSAGYVSASSNSVLGIGDFTGATGNYLSISNGGTFVYEGTSTTRHVGVGVVTGANSNYITVTGVNSTLNVNAAIALGIGYNTGAAAVGGNSNALNVSNGGAVISTSPMTVGNNGTGGVINLGNGGANIASITVGASFAQYSASAGTVPIAGGAVSSAFTPAAGTILVNLLSAGTTLNFNNGRLVAGASTVSSKLIDGAGSVDLTGSAYIEIPSGKNDTISTAISGSGTLIKEGAGTLTLDTLAATYSGSATITQGTLALTTLSPGSGKTLKGNGTVSAVLHMTNGSTFGYEVNSTTGLPDSQKANLLTVSGVVTLDSTSGNKVYLTLDDLASTDVPFATGTKFSLMNYSSTLSGGFFFGTGANVLGEGTSFDGAHNKWTINYGELTGGINFSGTPTGQFINLTAGALTAVPEPGSLLALGLLVGSGAFLRSRRKVVG